MIKISLLRRYDKQFGGYKLSAFYGLHRFEFGGEVTRSLHVWPFCISWTIK